MIIRRMLEEDLEQVYQIEESITSQPWRKDDFMEAMKKKSNIYLVADENMEICGYLGMWGIVGEGQIYNVAVKEEHRRKGIANAMMSLLLDLGKEAGIKEFTLEVRIGNQRAIRLYKKFGFREEGVLKDFYSFPKEDALIMWL